MGPARAFLEAITNRESGLIFADSGLDAAAFARGCAFMVLHSLAALLSLSQQCAPLSVCVLGAVLIQHRLLVFAQLFQFPARTIAA